MDRSSGDGRLAGGRGRESRSPALVSRSRELGDVSFGDVSFGAVLETDETPRVQWATPDGLEVVGCGVAAHLTASGADRFATLREAATTLFDGLEHDGPRAARPRAFGGLSFHDGHEPAGPWQGFEAASFVVPAIQVTRTDDATWVTTVADADAEATDALDRWHDRLAALPAMRPRGSGPGVRETRRTTTRAEWIDQVETALDRIEGGALEKVVLAQSLTADLEGPIDVPATLERLRRRYPNCYRIMIDRTGGGAFFGAPPERLVSLRGDRVETEALAGSVPRGETPAEDQALVERMRETDRFQREHGLVVEAITDQLAPLSDEVRVGEQGVRALATIQHLETPIEATLAEAGHVLEIVEALHPTPAVGGLPPETAWETIRSVESFDRGWYAAPIGWFDADGDGEFAVGIRSAVATGESVALFAGNGIVADSDPAEEWDEVQLKFRPVLDELR